MTNKTRAIKIARREISTVYVVAAGRGGKTYGYTYKTPQGIRTHNVGEYRRAVISRAEAVAERAEELCNLPSV